MARWEDVEAAQSDLARRVRARFDAYGLAIMATLRADGSPRLCGIEPLFWNGDVWLGMMPGSRKAADLARDARLALHSATTDRTVAEGDARITGRAAPVTDDATSAAYHTAFAEKNDQVPPGPLSLFRIDVDEVTFVHPDADHLVVEVWRAPTGGYVHTERS